MDLSLKVANVDFGECYNKIKDHYNIDEDLIIVLVENYKKLYKNKPTTSFSLFHPKTGEKLDGITICQNDVITVHENLYSLLNENDTNYESLIDLINQNINIFDPEDDFYTDLCFYFISPIKKDIPVRDRLEEFYPNISLCDAGCKTTGIDFTTKEALCDCNFKDILNNGIGNNELIGETTSEILEVINNSNIEVLKCLSKAFNYFDKNYGGFIVIALTIVSIIFTILFYKLRFFGIKIYIFEITKNYLSFLDQNSVGNRRLLSPPKKNENDEQEKKTENEESKNKFIRKNNHVYFYIRDTNRINKKLNEEIKKYVKNNNNRECQEFEKFKQEDASNINLSNLNEFFSVYLSKPIEEMDYFDALKYDKRESFYELLSEKLIIINTFSSSDPLRPVMVKVVILLLYIDLYFVINGLFFSEEYISEVYHLEKEDKFFSFVPRSIPRFIYTMFSSVIIIFLIECFFVEEKVIKRIFLREKDNITNLKIYILKTIKIIKKRLISFFVVVYIIFLFSFLYVISFNYVYHFTQKEWIISSIFIIIVLQILVLIVSLIATGLRFLSFRCKSERIYKLSNLINEV